MKQLASISACLLLSAYLLCLPSIQSAKATHFVEAYRMEHQSTSIREQLAADIKSLAAEPRFTKMQYERAVAYVQGQAQAVGLNAEADWFDVRNPWERGKSDHCELISHSGSTTPLEIVALTNSVEALDVTGEVVLVNYFFAKNQGPPTRDLTGRIVVFSRKFERDRSVKGYLDAVVQRNHGASWAARYGAKAVLVRSIQTDDNKSAHAGAVSYHNEREKIPAAALSVADADRLESLLSEARSPLSVRLNITPKHEERRQANVLIRIPGSTLPQETVLVGAHLDSHDVTPGAADDAAGVASVLAVMREFAKNPPARTIWLVLFGDEEINSTGSLEFVERYKAELSQPFRFVAALEVDDGDGSPWGLQVTSSARPEKAKAALTSLRSIADHVGYEADGLELRTDSNANGADVEKLWDCYGIPEIAILQDLSKYFDKHHSRNDTPENIDIDGLEQTARLLIRIMHVITSGGFVDLKKSRGAPEKPCAK